MLRHGGCRVGVLMVEQVMIEQVMMWEAVWWLTSLMVRVDNLMR